MRKCSIQYQDATGEEAEPEVQRMAADETRRVLSLVRAAAQGRVRSMTLIYALESEPQSQLWLMGASELVLASSRTVGNSRTKFCFAEVRQALEDLNRTHIPVGSHSSYGNFMRLHKKVYSKSHSVAAHRKIASPQREQEKQASHMCSTSLCYGGTDSASHSDCKGSPSSLRKANTTAAHQSPVVHDQAAKGKLRDFINFYKLRLKGTAGEAIRPEKSAEAQHERKTLRPLMRNAKCASGTSAGQRRIRRVFCTSPEQVLRRSFYDASHT